MAQLIREEARLIILKELNAQVDATLNSELLRIALETYGLAKSREWVHDEIAYLQEMGAVTVAIAGTVRVVTLTEKGLAHLKRHIAIEGVKRPSLAGG